MTFLSIIGLVLSIFFVILCVYSPRFRSAALLGLFGSFLITVFSTASRDAPHGNPSLVAVGVLLLVLAVYKGIPKYKAFKAECEEEMLAKEKANLQAERQPLIDFYQECQKCGVTTCTTEKEIQKATLLAQYRKLSFTDITALYLQAREIYETDSAEKNAAKLHDMKAEEEAKCTQLDQYSTLSGRDKRIAMLSAEREKALRRAATLRNGSSALVGASQQKEHDWAVHGGIASGIAGGAAGLATAMDIQAKNAKIRAQNEQNLRNLGPLLMRSYEAASREEAHAESLQEAISHASTCLVSTETPEECLRLLSFSFPKVVVSQTGTCTVTVTASLETPHLIFDDVPATIDGTVLAKIYDGANLIGVAKMVLPKDDVRAKTNLTGMCLFCGKPGHSYRVQFSAINLWAMEV